MLTTLCEDRAALDIELPPWKHQEVKMKFISCAAKVQHCRETDRHAAVTDACLDSQ